MKEFYKDNLASHFDRTLAMVTLRVWHRRVEYRFTNVAPHPAQALK